MVDLDELKRLAEEASAEAGGDWFCADLLEPGAPDISASTKAREFMHAFDPDTAKKLIAVARAAERVVAEGADQWGAIPKLRTALEELK